MPVRQLLAAALLLAACRSEPESAPLASFPLHLEEHLASARVEGSAVPKDLPAAVEWKLGESADEWRPIVPLVPGGQAAAVARTGDALRISLSEANRFRRHYRGGVYVDLPAWNREDWAYVVVRARGQGPLNNLTLGFNLRQRHGEYVYEYEAFRQGGESLALVADGAVHSYLFRADWTDSEEDGGGPWRQLGLQVGARGPATLEILSVSVIPKEARYAEAPAGIVTEPRDGAYRRALYTHAPGALAWRTRVPEGGRLDFGLGVLREDSPVDFRVAVAAEGAAAETVFREAWRRKGTWGQRSVDLSRWAGRTVTLRLETGGRVGAVGLWASPTLSAGFEHPSPPLPAGAREGDGRGGRGVRSSRPNILLYVIDAGGAEYMSAYGYPRRTTPNLERLAAEGVLFERAYSNSSWSKPSTTSFMTGLQHAVLGGFTNPSDPLPAKAATMAELLHGAGWQTGVFTSNTWCGTLSSLERGVDTLRETVPVGNSVSSAALQTEFWRWRDAYPGEPFWAHFQVTDVHWPWEAVPPFAGTFVSHAQRKSFQEMENRLGEAAGANGRFWALRSPGPVFDKAGIDRGAYFDAVRGVFDEAMAYADWQLGRLVERLKDRGEWENTILIVTADHGDWPGLGYLETPGEADPTNPARMERMERIPFLNPYLTRVPLVVVWPAGIPAGKRVREAVSLIDLLPTVLELAGQPRPDHLQGQSLRPLLLGQEGWRPAPVFLEEINYDPRTGEPDGAIEVVDGRWGASLAIASPKKKPEEGTPLLLYDLWNDPYCQRSVHAERPQLARRYRGLLERTLREHLALARRFPASGEASALGSEQLETLKSLGYLQ